MVRLSSLGFALLPPLVLAACVAPSAPPPPAAPRPAPVPVRPAPPPPPVSADWRDWPLTRGDWRYVPGAQGSAALYGPVGETPLLSLTCDRSTGSIRLARRLPLPFTSPAPDAMVVRTSTLTRSIAAPSAGSEQVATLGARDSLLDAMGFSRGRFVIEAHGLAPLVVPSWAEVLRVVEDCRS